MADLRRAWDRIHWHPHPPIDVNVMMRRVASAIEIPGFDQADPAAFAHHTELETAHRPRTLAAPTLPLVFKNRKTFSGQTLRHRVWYIAASLVIGIVGVIIGWKGATRHDIVPMLGAVSTYTTLSGERANIMLPDGSTVALNVASRLEVPVDYAAGNHTLHLVGEALFTSAAPCGNPILW